MIKINTNVSEFWNNKDSNTVLLIYGAGINSETIVEYIQRVNDIQIAGFIDNDTKKQGRYFNGYNIYAPEEVNEVFKNKKIKILISITDIFGAICTLEKYVSDSEVYFCTEQRASYINGAIASLRSKLIRDNNFSIIANTCAAARMYQLLGCKYMTPFVAVIIKPSEYIKMCANLKEYLSHEIKFIRFEEWMLKDEPYCLCKLGDIEIKFIHRNNFDQLKEEWQRRVERINFDNLFLIYENTHYQPTPKEYREFLNIQHGTKLILQRGTNLPLEHSINTTYDVHLFRPDILVEKWFKIVDFINHDVEY